MTKWKRTGEEEQQSAVSSCGKKRQMAKRERAERRTSYTADILTAADARRERDEREGGRDRGRAGWHTLPLSLSLCDAGLSYFLTALFDWASFTFSPRLSDCSLATDPPHFCSSTSFPFSSVQHKFTDNRVFTKWQHSRKETILRVPLLLLLLATPFGIISRRLHSPDAGKMLPSIESL